MRTLKQVHCQLAKKFHRLRRSVKGGAYIRKLHIHTWNGTEVVSFDYREVAKWDIFVRIPRIFRLKSSMCTRKHVKRFLKKVQNFQYENMSVEEVVEEYTFKNYDNDDNYKLFYTCDFPVEKDEEIAESIRQCLLNIDGQNELGIEPFICMKKNSKGFVFPSLKLYVPTCGPTNSDFSQLTPERILDELWRVRLEWKYKNVPDSKENSKWLFGLPTVPEVYPRSPVPIDLPTGDVCSECTLETPEIIRCPNQNRFIINAREQKAILKKGKTSKLAKNVNFKKSYSIIEPSLPIPIKYETAGQSKMEIIDKQLPTRGR